MGRQYRDELRELVESSAGAGIQTKRLIQAISACGAQPLIIVASGGAQIAARWMARLHIATFGQPATVVSPLEAISLSALNGVAVWLISQGGRHADILAAAHWAIGHSPLCTYGLIGQADSTVAKLIDAQGGLSCSLMLAPGIDGFLTTNGLWAMLCALTRAYGHHAVHKNPAGGGHLPGAEILNWASRAALDIPEAAAREVIAAIGDPWTIIGAEDLEVRCTEAALAHVWTTDYRNLGHGRHFWLADRRHETTCLFFASKDYASLDAWTREGLPTELVTAAVAVPFEGPLAGLASIAFSMHWTARLGDHRKRDPGRPGVPTFGERLYVSDHSVVPTLTRSTSPAQDAVARKLGVPPIEISESKHGFWLDAWDRYRRLLHRKTLRAVVFDYDGTLVYSHHRWDPVPDKVIRELRRLVDHGVYIGIATGRGDSIQELLRKALEGCDIKRIYVGYHNGACVRALGDPADDLDGACTDDVLNAAHANLKLQLGTAVDIQMRANQCTLRPKDRLTLAELWFQVRDLLDRDSRTACLPAWLSSHSIDVCVSGASKKNVIAHLASLLPDGQESILRVGDRGAWPGNDFEFLDHLCGVSVDECSLNPYHCWNVTGSAGAGPEGVVAILRHLVLGERSGEVSLDLEDEA